MVRFLCLFAFLGTLPVRAEEKPLSDATIHSQLVGTWITDPQAKQEVVGTSVFRGNGTGFERLHPRNDPNNFIRVDFKWSVKDGVLVTTSTKSSNTKVVPVNHTLKDKILSIDQDHYEFEAFEGYADAKGQRVTKVRKKN